MLKFLVNLLSWMLGIAFSAVLFLAFFHYLDEYTRRGFEWGEEFAYNIVAEVEGYEVEFILEQEASVAEVAEMLEELGVIRHALFYRLEMLLMGHTDYYEPGTWMLNKSMSATLVNARLRAQPIPILGEDQFMIPEGWTQRDMAVYFESRGWFTAEEFMYVANNHDFPFIFLQDIPDRPNRLEGYLFPDTYRVWENPTPVQVITTMLNRFNYIFNFEYRMRAEELGMTIDEVVIVASMVEKEVRVPDERPMVAQVIYNRLREGMQLQIDATVIYALDTHVPRVLYEHLRISHPHNTYYVQGLPWGPIGNPGAASIHAALFPAQHNYLFYVLVNAETGQHFFTRDYAQHLYMRATHMPRPWDAVVSED